MKREEIFVMGAVIVGVVLQIVSGPFPMELIKFPVNFILALVLLILAVKGGKAFRKSVYSLKFSVFLILLLTVQVLIMGFMSDNRIKDSWPFVITYFFILVDLAIVISESLKKKRRNRSGFLLIHGGLLILLIAAGLGSADKIQLFLKVNEGESVRNGYDRLTGKTYRLPFEITLEDFSIEYYPDRSIKSYNSLVTLKNSDSKAKKWDIRVNHPLRYGSWWIYQYSYDLDKGGDSKYAVLQLVLDPWLILAWVGISILFAGAVNMFWKGGRP